MIAGSSSIFLKCIWNKSCSWAALLKCWFRTDLGRENSTVFYIYMQGRQFLTVTRWSRSTSNFYALIGQNLTGEFMQKIYAASGNLFTDSWSRQCFVSSCDVFNCRDPWSKSGQKPKSERAHRLLTFCLQDVFSYERILIHELQVPIWTAFTVYICNFTSAKSWICCFDYFLLPRRKD